MNARARVLLLGALAASVTILAAPSHALAGTYTALICGQGETVGSGDGILRFLDDGSTGFFDTSECAEKEDFDGLFLSVSSSTHVSGAAHWRITAAPRTTLETVTALRGADGWDPGMEFEVVSGNGFQRDLIKSKAEATTEKSVTYPVGSTTLTGTLRCNACHPVSGTQFTSFVGLVNITATVGDSTAPKVRITPPSPTAPQRGTVPIPFEAEDEGGGVEAVQLLADFARTVSLGTVIDAVHDANGGLCVKPFLFLAPCAPTITSTFNFDTTRLSDGTHTLTAVDADAAGNEGESAHFTILVHNAPTSTARPEVTGATQVGQLLHATGGAWEGDPSFTFQWLRCPPGVGVGSEAGCTPIDGANQNEYRAASADVGQVLAVKVTGENFAGTQAALSAPTVPIEEKKSGGGGGGTEKRGGGNGGGGDGSPEGRIGGAPQTTLVVHPHKRTKLRTAKFTFNSDQPTASFECKLDKGAFKPCRSPFKRKVKPGRHTFRVVAVSNTGVPDLTPVVCKWTVS